MPAEEEGREVAIKPLLSWTLVESQEETSKEQMP